MKYRPDIDGLRAIAIIPVILYHAGYNLFSGGYIGVDVFFVISGFLITSLIINEIQKGKFSLFNFYLRRIRRLFPALYTLVLFVTILTSFYLLPKDFVLFAKSLISTVFYVSNIFLWRNIGGYFSLNSEHIPLLHTWSLGVEEQYYIFYAPFLAIIFYIFGKDNFRKYGFMGVLLIFIISFIFSIFGVKYHPLATFYLLPTRAWELMLGAFLSFYITWVGESTAKGYKLYNFAAFFGLILILFPIFIYNKHTPFPGQYALFPCFGTFLIIYSNTFSDNMVKKLLESKSFVYIGLLSYSLYLWHWPLLSFVKYWDGLLPSHVYNLLVILAILLTFLFAYTSYTFIETPIRKIDFRKKPKNLLIPTGGIMLIFTVISLFIVHNHGLINRFPSSLRKYIYGLEDYNKDRYYLTWKRLSNTLCNKFPTIGDTTVAGFSFVVLGDSHGEALRRLLDLMGKKYRLKGKIFAQGGNIPFLNVYRVDTKPNYWQSEDKICFFNWLKKHNIRFVFLIARWAFYIKGYYKYEKLEKNSTFYICSTLCDNCRRDFNFQLYVFKSGLKGTLKELYKVGVEKVIIFYDVPEIGWNVPEVLFKKNFLIKLSLPVYMQKFIPPTLDEYIQRQSEVLQLFLEEKKDYSDKLILIKTYLPFFKTKYCKITDDEGYPLYSDDDHLSIHGNYFLSRKIKILDNIFTEISNHITDFNPNY